MSGVSRESPFARHRFGSTARTGTQEFIRTLVLEVAVLDPRSVDIGVFLPGEALDGGQHLFGDPAQGTGLGFTPFQILEVKRFTDNDDGASHPGNAEESPDGLGADQTDGQHRRAGGQHHARHPGLALVEPAVR